jgi:hypothetical protein
MIYQGYYNTTIMDFVNNVAGTLDSVVATMGSYGITTLDQNLAQQFDVNYDTTNNIVNTLTISDRQLSTGDRNQYSILTKSGSFSDGFSEGFGSTSGTPIVELLNYFYGSLDYSNIDSEHIINLNYLTEDKQSNLNLSFSPVLQRFIYAYPSSYGNLSLIRDDNGFNVSSSFLTTLITINTISYIVYYSDVDTTVSNFKNSFYV